MRRHVQFGLTMTACLVVALAPLAQAPKAPAGGVVAQAQGLVDALVRGDFKGAEKDFDGTMSSALPPDKLAQTWQMLQTQAGSFKSKGATWTVPYAGFNVVFVECRFDRMTLDAKVAFDAQGKIGGLYFVPAQQPPTQQASPAPSQAPGQPPAQAAAPEPAPAYVRPDAFTEKDVQVGFGEWILPGKLAMPNGQGPFPAVVLVHGSGPESMDESVGGVQVFKDLAQGLASSGVAVLRYDKRTKVYPQKMAAAQGSLTVREEVLNDVYAALSLLRRTDGVDPKRIFVLGHSLGGMLAPRIAAADRSLAGIVILAGNTRPLEDLILDQLAYIASLQGVKSDDPKMEALKKQVAKVKDPQLSASTPASELPFNAPASYWLDLRAYDPAKTAQALTIPILVLQGQRDYQVTAKDYEGWKAALDGHPNATLKLYPNLNHLFVEGQGKSTPAEYEKPAHVSAQAVNDVAAWVSSQAH